MKKLFILLFSCSAITLYAANGTNKIYESDPCNCWIERDSTWNIVPFDVDGMPGTPPEYRNDDGNTQAIALPFSFCFYGVNYTSVYINNNGNVSLDGPYSTYTADSFPSPNFKMIAPFWGDADTRGALSGIVYYKLTSTALLVQWDHIGYYQEHDDLLNTFQLIITDGFDQLLDAGKNVAFCYQDMQWTTGDASQGAGGFGGIPATVGANSGNSTFNSIQIGRFDQPGSTYLGPYGGYSGVDFLDNQSYSFDLCSSNNIAPFLKYSGLCDTLEICMNDTAIVDFEFYSPELGQNTTSAFNFFGLSGCGTLQNTPGNIASASAYIVGQAGNIGYHSIDVTATDNGSPQQSTTVSFVVHIKNVNATFTYSPNPIQIGDTVTFTANANDNDFDTWDFGDGSPIDSGLSVTHVYSTASLFDVIHIGSNSQCQDVSSQQQIEVLFVGIDNLNSNLQVGLSPNPTNGVLTLNAKDLSANHKLQISDVQGRIVFERKNIRANDQIDISNLEIGIYFYRITSEKGERKGQLMKD